MKGKDLFDPYGKNLFVVGDLTKLFLEPGERVDGWVRRWHDNYHVNGDERDGNRQ